MTDREKTVAPAAPAAAHDVFGPRLSLAERYAELLVDRGLTHGVLGPREVPRIWDRHLLNCAVLTDLLPDRSRIVDVGSGAGLPGLVLAIRRPDLQVVLVESMQRRVEFLVDAAHELGLDVDVISGRVEDRAVRTRIGQGANRVNWVTARAVAPLPRLAAWCLPLLRPGGQLLAMKGRSAAAEVAALQPECVRLGIRAVDIVSCGGDLLAEPTTVVRVYRRGGGR